MEEISETLEGLDRPLVDLDVTPGGQVFAITEKGKGKEAKGQRIFVNGQPLPVPVPINHPVLRALDETRLLVADSRTREKTNAWILRTTGEVEDTFWIGEEIEDIIPLQNWLAVAYFDQAYATQFDGVVLFNPAGEAVFRHNEANPDTDTVVDCYCACRAGRDQVLFLGYPDFPVILLDAVTRQETIWKAPSEVRGASAVTMAGGIAFFHGNYQDGPGIYRWRLGDRKAERIGEHTGRLRGLSGGRFLHLRTAGYTSVSLTDEVRGSER